MTTTVRMSTSGRLSWNERVDHFAEIMPGNVGCHAHGDTRMSH